MRRRDVLRAGGLAGAAALAGCTSLVETRSLQSAPPMLDDRPQAVYFPTHVEGMEMVGTGAAGDYRFGLTYSYPHRFWNINGDDVSRTDIEDGDSVHLMTTVWDPETGTVLPDTGLSLEITRDGEVVSQEVIYPMLSQPMGFHYGANFGLDGDGSYDVTVSVGGMSTRRTGAFQGRFAEAASATVGFDYSRSERDEIAYENTPDRAGERTAREPMDMQMPTGLAPEPDALPGTVRGTATSGDATFVVTTLDSPPAGVEGSGAYLAASARTPYNRLVVPMMALSATLARGGDTVYEGPLSATLDPDLGYHYGAAVEGVRSGDGLEVRVETPPQVARHEGYETAFREMEPMTLEL